MLLAIAMALSLVLLVAFERASTVVIAAGVWALFCAVALTANPGL